MIGYQAGTSLSCARGTSLCRTTNRSNAVASPPLSTPYVKDAWVISLQQWYQSLTIPDYLLFIMGFAIPEKTVFTLIVSYVRCSRENKVMQYPSRNYSCCLLAHKQKYQSRISDWIQSRCYSCSKLLVAVDIGYCGANHFHRKPSKKYRETCTHIEWYKGTVII